MLMCVDGDYDERPEDWKDRTGQRNKVCLWRVLFPRQSGGAIAGKEPSRVCRDAGCVAVTDTCPIGLLSKVSVTVTPWTMPLRKRAATALNGRLYNCLLDTVWRYPPAWSPLAA